MDQNIDMDSSESSFKSETPQVTMTGQIKKPNKCTQCEHTSSEAGDLRKHLKTHNGEKQKNAVSVTLHPLTQALWKDIWKYTVEKSQTNATSVIINPLGQAIWAHINKTHSR